MSRSADNSFDVLVVGGGLAGLMAALAAREEGASVAVLSLGPAGRSGNTAVASTGVAAAGSDPGNNAADFLNDLLRSGKGLADPALAARLAGDSEDMVSRLETLGVRFRKENGALFRGKVAGHSRPRSLLTQWEGMPYALRGLTLLTPLLEKLQQGGVPLVNGLRAVELLRAEGRVAGVLAYDRKRASCRAIRAGRVVLTSGGYGMLFRRTNNVSDSYGDGIAMALAAGATVRDMEMVQFYPTMMFRPMKMTLSNPLFAAGAVLRNSDKETFLNRYEPSGGIPTRDTMARAIFMEVRAGRGINGCVWLDCTAMPESAHSGILKDFCKALAKYGLDPRRDFLEATPCAHYTLGGICIDEWGRTDVPGLYAAGEVCGGVHGANRLGGAALMEAAVFGRRAGLAAATDALPAAGEPAVPALKPDVPGTREKLVSAFSRLRDLLWDHVSLIRDAAGLQAALEGIQTLRGELSPEPGVEETAFGRTLHLAEAVARSAQLRAESRGAHYREDFPQVDETWRAPVLCSLQDGGLRVDKGPLQ